jgi:phosphoglycerate dehydrogenase-like enzyme
VTGSTHDGIAHKKVVLSEHLNDGAAAWLAERVELVRQPHEDAEALRHELAAAEGLIVRTYTIVDDALLDAAPALRVVARAGVGLDNIDLDACRRRGVRVVHTPDANTQAVLEYVWALIFDALRPRLSLNEPISPEDFHRHRRENVGQQAGDWTLGVLGMGRIGRRVAEVGRAFGLRVQGHDLLSPAELGLDPGSAAGGSGVEFVEPGRLWAESDLLTIHVDGRPENRHLIDAGVLEQLKPTCLLLNTSRGMVIDPAALAGWAERVVGQGSGAVLDVHDPEPPPADYPLWGLSNVRLLPHLASRTDRAMRNMSWVVRDVVRVLQGEEPEGEAPKGNG